MNAFLFVIWTLVRGFLTVFTKKAQVLTERSYRHSLYFVFFYSVAQWIMLMAWPPYNYVRLDFIYILYPILFGMLYVVSYVTLVMAIGTGPTALTNVIYTFHTVIPMLTGLIIWNEPLRVVQALGVTLTVVSIFLFYHSVKRKEKADITLRWILFVLVATLSIGIAVVFTQLYSRSYPDLQKQYLAIYTFTASIVSFLILLGYREKIQPKPHAPVKYYLFIVLTAVCQNVSNIIFMYFLAVIPSVILFPMINSISILIFIIMGRIFFSEKLSRLSFMGICSSILSLILLNL